jgi:ribokinase
VPGETLQASDDSGYMLPGGKGANQAVAAARLGGQAELICMFGSDAYGPQLEKECNDSGVITSLCTKVDKPSGRAYILLQRM